VNLKYAHSDIVSIRMQLAHLVEITILLHQTNEVVFKGFATEHKRWSLRMVHAEYVHKIQFLEVTESHA